ncbi:MAG: flippase [Candidatus Diapherotrites archaeon]|uniref:Flippase n=1 Tax=Candidatus Iainarchaeum sp. TaxID=3101447 RepID=A0A939C4B8_9ARCH|nr:flippase [Candidatus Diapherotrites archaeon]
MQDLKVIARGAGFVFIGFFVSKLLSYFYRVLLARFLGPEELGIFSMGLAVVGIVTVFGAVGLYQGVLHFVAVYESRGEKEKVRGAVLGSLKMQLATSLVAMAAMLLIAEPVAMLAFQQPSLTLVLQLLALTIPLQVITSNFMILTQAFKKIEYKVLVRHIIENLAKLALTFWLVFLGFGAAGASLALALAGAFALAVSFFFIQKKVYRVFSPGEKAVYNWRELFGYSWPLFAVGFFMLIMGNIDTISLGILNTAFNTGIYNVATPTARFLEMPSFAFLSLFLPVATGLYATRKMDDLGKAYKAVTRWIFSLTLPCALFAVLFAREILSIMFGPVYAEGAAALAILSLGFFVFYSLDTVRSMLQPIAKTRLVLYNTIAAAVLNVILNVLLIPSLGIVGAALATTTSYFFWSLLAFFEVYSAIKIHPFSRAYWKPTLASFIAILLFFALKSSIPAIDLFQFPLKVVLLLAFGAAFLAVYAVLFIAFRGLQPEDIEILKAIEAKTGVKAGFARNIIKRFI